MKRSLAEIRHTKFMQALDRDISRLRRALNLIQQMDAADRYYLLSRLKAKECAVAHWEQTKVNPCVRP